MTGSLSQVKLDQYPPFAVLDSLRKKYVKLPTYPRRYGLERILELDDNLKKLMKDLGAAINDALSDSSEISGAIQNVRDSGYDVFLVLEATIGFNRRSSEDVEEASGQAVLRRDIELNVNAQDMKFLKSLKIKVDDLESQ